MGEALASYARSFRSHVFIDDKSSSQNSNDSRQILSPEVSASFLPGTTVSYTFKHPHESGRNSSARPSSVYSDTTLRGEDVSLSFRTNQSPALLLYVSSHHGESLALLINKHGEEAFILKEFLRGADL